MRNTKRLRFLILGRALAGIAGVALAQLAFFDWIIAGGQRLSVQHGDAVIVYAGDPGRTPAGFRTASGADARWLLFSGGDEVRIQRELRRHRLSRGCVVRIVRGAYTTDQNARTVMPLLRKAGVKSAVLVTSWYHLPRAYFLTRLYSLGSGIEWDCVGAEPNPPGWWKRPEFRSELLRFWGSLGRVVLAVVGIENWPRPAGMPKGK